MNEQPVLLETTGRVGVITLDRPKQMHARFASDDAHEGKRACHEKHAPEFTHR